MVVFLSVARRYSRCAAAPLLCHAVTPLRRVAHCLRGVHMCTFVYALSLLIFLLFFLLIFLLSDLLVALKVLLVLLGLVLVVDLALVIVVVLVVASLLLHVVGATTATRGAVKRDGFWSWSNVTMGAIERLVE